MGLCKCPKRKVTNLFCFEHKVNVCETCLVTDHVRCVVKSYLQWLQDSDFETSCCICQDTLEAGDVVRLMCYDILHVSCAEKFLLAYPPHTAPDGFFCPACHAPFIPPEVVASPVADQLRGALQSMKDLQKRLNGLSASIPEHSQSSPPSDRRPDPEGKEGQGDDNFDNVESKSDHADVVAQSETSSTLVAAAKSVIDEEFTAAKTGAAPDDHESDSISSASDFIATHSGSNHRDVDPSSAAPLDDDVSTLITVPSSSSSLSLQQTMTPSCSSANDWPNKTALNSMYPGVKEQRSTNRLVEENHVHDIKDDALIQPKSSTSAKSITIPMETFNSPPVESPDVSWSVSNSSQQRFAASAASPSPSPSRDRNFTTDVTNSLQHYANGTRAEQEYSPPPPKLPFSDSQQFGTNSRTSTSSATRLSHTSVTFQGGSFRDEDHDDHKYRRKPIMDVIRTWLKIFSPPRGRRSSPSLWRRFVIIVLVAVMSLICLVLLFHHMGRSGRDDDDDPLLDLKANPFVKVDDS